MGNKSGKASDISIGFGKASIYGTYVTDKYLADDADVRTLIARNGDNTAVLAIADFCDLWQSTCLRLRDKISAALKVPRDSVGVFTTQNHSVCFEGGDDTRLDAGKLDQAFLDSVTQAASNVTPVEIARVAVHPNPPLNICRRFALDGFGKFCVFYGHRVEGNKADASHIIKKTLNNFRKGNPVQISSHNVVIGAPSEFEVPPAPVPVPEPFYARPADDDLLQALFFRTLDGAPHGSILRFASHPIAANHLDMTWQSGDFPAYARRYLESEFGGFSLYLGGPCGDQTPMTGRKSLEFASSHGKAVAAEALKKLPGALWERGGPVKAVSPVVELHIRKDCPKSLAAAAEEQRTLEARIKELAASGAPLTEIKKLSDRYGLLALQTSRFYYDASGIDFEKYPDGIVRHPLFVMRIGKSVIAGLPGEPFGAYSVQIRDKTIGDDCIVVEEANAWTSYHPTKEDWPLGAYEACNNLFGPEAEDTLVQTAQKAVLSLKD